MSLIKLTLPGTDIPVDGKSVSFVAPCKCNTITGLQIDDVEYAIVDSLGNNIAGLIGYWEDGAIVTVTLDVTNKKAYLQNSARAAAPQCVHLVLYASEWSAEKTYSLNSQYDSRLYDLDITIDGDNITLEQKHAYDDADIVGLSSTNALKALGNVPTIDIPVIAKVVYK